MIQPPNRLRTLSESLASERSAIPIDSSQRFSLANSEASVDFFVRDSETGEKQRFLLAFESGKSNMYYKKLKAAGAPQFYRKKIDPSTSIYEIPIHVKPFHHEQITADEPSTETHISGVELFGHFGSLWRSVFNETRAIPENPIRATALNNTEDINNSLILIPPYVNWIKTFSDHKATELQFLSSVESEITQTYPDANFKELLYAIHQGWNK